MSKMISETKTVLLVLKELGLHEINIKPSTMMATKPDEVLESISMPDGSVTLRRPVGELDLVSCKFDDIKAKIASHIQRTSLCRFTLNSIMADVFSINPDTASHSERERIGQALSDLGWKRTSRNKVDGKRQYLYGRASL